MWKSLGAAVPGAPPSLADVRVELGTIGGVPSYETPVDLVPRSTPWWGTLADEIHAFLGGSPSVADLALVAQVVRGLAPHPRQDALLALIDRIVRPADRRRPTVPAPVAPLAVADPVLVADG
jgi:hypothetical protein